MTSKGCRASGTTSLITLTSQPLNLSTSQPLPHRTFPATRERKKRQNPGTYDGEREAKPIAAHAAYLLPSDHVTALSDATEVLKVTQTPSGVEAHVLCPT